MWTQLPESTRAWRQRCLTFAREHIAPYVEICDRENRFPTEVHAAAYDAGIPNVDFPIELGGQGLSGLDSVVGVEALASVCAPIAFSLGFNRGALHPVLAAGTSEQKQQFIAELIKKRQYASLCLTEPESSGSNLMGIETTATRTEHGWVLRGKKAMVGNGRAASLYLVLARMEERGHSAGLSFFAVPRGPGVVVGENTNKLGFRAVETPTVEFEEVPLLPQHLIGAPGSGAALMMDTLRAIRVGGSATICGIVVGALSDALPWIREREVYGGVLGSKSHVQLQLGSAYSQLQLIRNIIYEAARRREAGVEYAQHASIAKLHAAELALHTTSDVAQLFGWRGIDGDWPIQKRLRDARQTSIFEGTSEVQKLGSFHSLVEQFLSTGTI